LINFLRCIEMKILYITNHIKIANESGGFINDYLNDLTFYGFYELYKTKFISEIVDSTPIISLYKQYKSNIPKQNIWGGMTSCWLIDKDEFDRSNIIDKIKNKYYDIVIYGSSRRCLDYYDLVSKIYDPKKIIMLDGNDDNDIQHSLSNKHLYFKRELHEHIKNVNPISFSYPTCKLSNTNKTKTQDYGTVIPDDKSTYIFKDEESYYNDYNVSYYGVTTKKAGWDCMRHYEILGNYCMTYFPDLDKCPENCITTLPKKLIKQSNNLLNENFDVDRYYDIIDETFDHFKQHCLTKSIAKYILEKL